MNRRIAGLQLARRHPDFDTLAANLGKSPETLRKELTGAPGYKWGVEDEEMLVQFCQVLNVDDYLGPITAGAVNAGATVVRLPKLPTGGSPTFQCLADAAKEFGAFMATAADALADGSVTKNELQQVEKECGLLMGKLQMCLAGMAAMHEARKPKGDL